MQVGDTCPSCWNGKIDLDGYLNYFCPTCNKTFDPPPAEPKADPKVRYAKAFEVLKEMIRK